MSVPAIPTQGRPSHNQSEKAVAVLATYGKTFHFAGRLLGRNQLRDCARLYRFCRYVDDLVDRSPNSKQALKQMCRIEHELAVGYSIDPPVADFLSLARYYNLDLTPVYELMQGLIADLNDVRIENEGALKRYCYRVAGTVGLLMCGVLGVRDPCAFPHAIDLGIAMQLTNIARDVAEDAQADRRYLPADLLGPISPARIVVADDQVRPKLRASVQALLEEAERYYRSGEAGIAFLPLRARLAILVAARVYRAIGGVLARRGFATWLGRAKVTNLRKFAIAVHAIADFVLKPQYRRLPASHDANLHKHLLGLPGSNSGFGAN